VDEQGPIFFTQKKKIANGRPPVAVGTRWSSIQSRWLSRGSRWEQTAIQPSQTTAQKWSLGADGRLPTPDG
ncbi:unnamed protein product, partial [Sphenostylis stenocarpa]